MTTTTISLGWTGESDPRDARKTCEKIVMRTNRLLNKLESGTGCCYLDGNSITLKIVCDLSKSSLVDYIAHTFMVAEINSVRETENFLFEEIIGHDLIGKLEYEEEDNG